VVGGAAPMGPRDENLQQPEHDEPLRTQEERKKGGGVCPSPAATKTRRRQRTGAAAMESGGARARVVVCCGCKEGRRSSSASLNSSRERKEGRWKGDHRPASLPLMVGGQSDTIGNREGKRQGNGGEFDRESYCLNWLVQAVGERKGRWQESRLWRRAGEAEMKKKGRGRGGS
jgi:hypothetical protein